MGVLATPSRSRAALGARAVADRPVAVTFSDWTGGRAVPSLGTNFGAEQLPFQTWHRFKEAFAPELIARAISESPIPVSNCLDPFGGSGTTALACQFLGVVPITAEVNPFLADVIEAKLTSYDIAALRRDLRTVNSNSQKAEVEGFALPHAPRTFVEPGVRGRWLFDRDVAVQISRLLSAISGLKRAEHRRLFRVLLGGQLVALSNVVVSGKGRRYRGGWQGRRVAPDTVNELFNSAARSAISEITCFGTRSTTSYSVIRGDSREVLGQLPQIDLAVFSPPYPNSFDYTDVYNIELWVLGYLAGPEQNKALRRSTLSSHVQISRDFAPAPTGSSVLATALEQMTGRSSVLWNPRLPSMVGAYFADMMRVLDVIRTATRPSGHLWMVVGDSGYAGIRVQTAEILRQLAEQRGWGLVRAEPFRSMRSSPQQGGSHELHETLVVFERRAD